ncbi:MAG: hypothetical protein LBS35_02295 [Synergistaceae bacterium]|jgi:hypothetical protein|nr:hypothetical protein [Synergistaceae bacterium]
MGELKDIVVHYKNDFETTIDDDTLTKSAALYYTIRHWAEKSHVDGIASTAGGR